MLPQHPLMEWRDRLAKSRVFTLSLAFHVIIIAIVGKVVIQRVSEPAEDRFPPPVGYRDELPPERPEAPEIVSTEIAIAPELPATPFSPNEIRSNAPDGGLKFFPPVVTPAALSSPQKQLTQLTQASSGLTQADRKRIETFATWSAPGDSSSRPLKERKFSFTAFVGRYQMGNWDSTIRMSQGKITGGSLPNLLYAMDKWSKGKIDTNERNVRAIALDSDELLAVRPPFVFLTGTRDFRLTEKEVENLRLYIRSGGAVWGDSSVPGRRSAFDNAFRREMEKVLGGDTAKFESLPQNHSIYTAGYFPDVHLQPPGINNYQESVDVLRWNGEIAVLHTRNDYGDMWQVGLDSKGQIDTSRNERGEYVALDPALWSQRGIYVRNLEQPAVEQAYRFGFNVVMHLLTRWENRLTSSPSL